MLDKKKEYVQIEVGENITCAQFGTEVKIYCGTGKGWSLKFQTYAMLYPKKDYLKR